MPLDFWLHLCQRRQWQPDVCRSALTWSSIYFSLWKAATFPSKLDVFLSFKDSLKMDWLGTSHLQMEILWLLDASSVSMDYVYMHEWMD